MSTGLVVGGSHTPAGARAPGGGCLLTQPCLPSTLLVRDTKLGTSFPRVGFPAVPWGRGGGTAKPPAPAAPRATRQEADGIPIPSGLTGGSVTAGAERACSRGALRWPPRPSTCAQGGGCQRAAPTPEEASPLTRPVQGFPSEAELRGRPGPGSSGPRRPQQILPL